MASRKVFIIAVLVALSSAGLAAADEVGPLSGSSLKSLSFYSTEHPIIILNTAIRASGTQLLSLFMWAVRVSCTFVKLCVCLIS